MSSGTVGGSYGAVEEVELVRRLRQRRRRRLGDAAAMLTIGERGWFPGFFLFFGFGFGCASANEALL
jgi:hypothetical protein